MAFVRKDKLVPVFVTLDISSSDTGVAVAIGGVRLLVDHVKKRTKHKDYADLLVAGNELVTKVEKVLGSKRILDMVVWVEQPFYVPCKSFPGPIYMMHGILLSKLADLAKSIGAQFWWDEVHVSTWRGWLLERWNVKPKSRKSEDMKAATAEIMKAHYGVDNPNDNAVDAAGIMAWLQANAQEA